MTDNHDDAVSPPVSRPYERWTYEDIVDMSRVQLAAAIMECSAAGIAVPDWISNTLVSVPGAAFPNNWRLDVDGSRLIDVRDLLVVCRTDMRLQAYTEKIKKQTAKTLHPDQDYTPDAIKDVAVEILYRGSPLEQFRKTFKTLHSGDLEVLDTVLLAQCAQHALTTQGIQPVLSGHTGAGKTSSVQAALHLTPTEFLLSGSFSDKSLFYDTALKPGCVIFSDDTTLKEEILATIKRAMSNFQEPTQHRTITKEGGKNVASVLEIPPRQIFLFTSAMEVGDDQLGNRQYRISVEQTPTNEKDFLQFTLERMLQGRELYPVTDDVLICREILRDIKKQLYRVRVPFAHRIMFADAKSKRNILMFYDFIQAAAVLMHRQREHIPAGDDGIETIEATEDDFYTARDLFQYNQDTRKFDLTKEEKALLDFIIEQGGTITEPDLIQSYAKNGKHDATRMKIRRLLYGVRDKGGLLGKVPGMTFTQENRGITTETRRNVNVITVLTTMRTNLMEYKEWVTLRPEHEVNTS